MNEFIFEIYSEEIPSRFLSSAESQLYNNCIKLFAENGITYDSFESYVTPNRMGVFARGVTPVLPSFSEEKRGPKVSSPQNAIDGFLKNYSATIEQCIEKDGYIYLVIEKEERHISSVIPNIISEIINKLSWPKSMRWPQSKTPWARPVRNITCMFDQKIVNMSLFGIDSNNKSLGFRLDDKLIDITSIDKYKKDLVKQGIIISREERINLIKESLNKIAKEKNILLLEDQSLVEESAGIAEHPIVRFGVIDKEFLSLPSEVIQSAMRTHQKYFTFVNDGGDVAPFFAYVCDKYGDNQVSQNGYEFVLRARLSDARFFFDNDKKNNLENMSSKLSTRIFHDKLGNLYQKIKRLECIMDSKNGKRAAILCKSDLLSTMVGEFPELQGIMGGIYSKYQNEDEKISTAIKEHYKPVGLNDKTPMSPLGLELSLKDKLDTLVGFFGIGLQPTSSKDPFALRRCALGLIRCVLDNGISNFFLFESIVTIKKLYEEQGITLSDDTEKLVIEFILERMNNLLSNDIDSKILISLKPKSLKNIDIFSISKRAKILNDYLSTESGKSLLDIFKRSYNIYKDNQESINSFNIMLESMDKLDAELYNSIHEINEPIETAIRSNNYENIIKILSNLQPKLSNYFEKTLIMDKSPELRSNRLWMLKSFCDECLKIANFTKLI